MPVLHEPGLVLFDHGQCVEIAHLAEEFLCGLVLTRVDAGDECFQDDALDVRLSGFEYVVLHEVERDERVLLALLRCLQRSEERRVGKDVSVRLALGGRRSIKKKKSHYSKPM